MERFLYLVRSETKAPFVLDDRDTNIEDRLRSFCTKPNLPTKPFLVWTPLVLLNETNSATLPYQSIATRCKAHEFCVFELILQTFHTTQLLIVFSYFYQQKTLEIITIK